MLNVKKMKHFYNDSFTDRDLLASGDSYRRDVTLEKFISLEGQIGTNDGKYLDLGCGRDEITQRLAAEGYDAISFELSMLF